jgi:Protein of unknown function (DUF2442)
MTTLELEVGDLKARAVEFTANELVVTLLDGRKIITSLDRYPRLHRASAAQRANYEIMPMGIHWPDIDEDSSIAGMLGASAPSRCRALAMLRRKTVEMQGWKHDNLPV